MVLGTWDGCELLKLRIDYHSMLRTVKGTGNEREQNTSNACLYESYILVG